MTTKNEKNFEFSAGLNACDYDSVELPEFGIHPLAWMYPKNSILGPLFNLEYHRLMEKGIQQRESQKLKVKRFCEDQELIQVDLAFTSILFALLCLGLILSIGTVTFEHLWACFKKGKL